ncbi:hypothetical protein OROMI_033564 [Orobanche minor]
MDTPARTAPKYHLLFLLLLLLSILLVIVCSSGVFFSPAKDIEHQLQTDDQIFLSSRRKLLTKTTMHNLLGFLTSNSRALSTVPSTTAVTNPMSPPTNPVTTPGTSGSVVAPPPPTGQIWCVANNKLPAASLQGALDYACGNGADCAAIQPRGNCYYPDTVQDHASYAFNSYYQTHPNETSCRFGGAAVVTNANPRQWYLHLSIIILDDTTSNNSTSNSNSNSNNSATLYDSTSNNDDANSKNNTILSNSTSNDSNSKNDDSNSNNNTGFIWQLSYSSKHLEWKQLWLRRLDHGFWWHPSDNKPFSDFHVEQSASELYRLHYCGDDVLYHMGNCFGYLKTNKE